MLHNAFSCNYNELTDITTTPRYNTEAQKPDIFPEGFPQGLHANARIRAYKRSRLHLPISLLKIILACHAL
jgi:hypothetical protein